MTIFHCDCRPQNDDKSDTNKPLDVKDTEDEFVIKKPSDADLTDPKYSDFLDELYRNDKSKQSAKTKRDVSEKIAVENPKGELDIPNKPLSSVDPASYDRFISHLYANDKLKREKRSPMIVFR